MLQHENLISKCYTSRSIDGESDKEKAYSSSSSSVAAWKIATCQSTEALAAVKIKEEKLISVLLKIISL